MKRKMIFTVTPSDIPAKTRITIETSGSGKNYGSEDLLRHFRKVTGGIFETIVRDFDVEEIQK
jgi:hypothetical protein